MINKEKTSAIYSTIPKEKKAVLEEIAKEEGYKLSQFIKKILLDYLKKEA